MPNVIIGGPEDNSPKIDENEPVFWIHENLSCTISHKPDGTWVHGWGKDGKHIFDKHFANDVEAFGYIDAKKDFFGTKEGKNEGSKDGKNEGTKDA